MWEGIRDWTELQLIDPYSSGYRSLFPVLLGCSTGGLGAQPLWDMVLIPASSLQLLNQRSWGPPLLGAGSLYSILSPTDWTSCLHPGYIIVRCPPSCESQIALNSTCPQSRLYPDIPRPDAPVIYTGAFPILTVWPGWGQYATLIPLRVPSMAQIDLFKNY